MIELMDELPEQHRLLYSLGVETPLPKCGEWKESSTSRTDCITECELSQTWRSVLGTNTYSYSIHIVWTTENVYSPLMYVFIAGRILLDLGDYRWNPSYVREPQTSTAIKEAGVRDTPRRRSSEPQHCSRVIQHYWRQGTSLVLTCLYVNVPRS